MPADLSLTLYYTSLALSAVGVVLFLWLMREPREERKEHQNPSEDDGGKTRDASTPSG